MTCTMYQLYRIHPNFRDAQFLWIALSKRFAGTIFVDQGFRVYDIQKFCKLNYHGLLKSAKVTHLENLDVYGRWKEESKKKKGSEKFMFGFLELDNS